MVAYFELLSFNDENTVIVFFKDDKHVYKNYKHFNANPTIFAKPTER